MSSKVVLDEVRKLAKERPYGHQHTIGFEKDRCVLIEAAGGTNVSYGQISVGYGTAFAFGYRPNRLGPVWALGLTNDADLRVASVTGCLFRRIRTTDPKEALQFVMESLDAGNAVQVPGPEDSIVYGYEGPDSSSCVHAVGMGGPTLEGRLSFEEFGNHIRDWGWRGLASFQEAVDTGTPGEIATHVIADIVQWQTTHPAAQHDNVPPLWVEHGNSDQHWYGVHALEELIRVVAEGGSPDLIGFNHQLNAKRYLAEYLTGAATTLPDEVRRCVLSAASYYTELCDTFSADAETGSCTVWSDVESGHLPSALNETLRCEKAALDQLSMAQQKLNA